jgi:hypothetical protein
MGRLWLEMLREMDGWEEVRVQSVALAVETSEKISWALASVETAVLLIETSQAPRILVHQLSSQAPGKRLSIETRMRRPYLVINQSPAVRC